MERPLQHGLGAIVGAAALSAVLLWSGHSAPASHASTPLLSGDSAASSPAAAITQSPANGFAEVAKSVTPAVVNITTAVSENVSGSRDMPWPFGPRGHRGPEPPFDPRERRGGGMGSGVIVTPDGYIITNNHVVDGAKELTVTLPDNREFTGRIVGTDPKTDLAVVKIDGQNLPFVSWGDSSRLQVGEYVLAIGNPFGLNSTVTLGIVSALGRGRMGITQYEDFIQTDAAINPGNSGGALVNTKGELVGINTAIFSQTGGYQGVGFAVPTAMAKPVYESLVKTGRVVRGYLGIGIQDLTRDLSQSFGLKDVKGALVSEVKEDGPADQAGLKQGDVIIGYQGSPVEDAVALQRLVTRTAVGTKATVKVVRDGREKELTVTVGEQPDTIRTAKAETGQADRALAGLTVRDLNRQAARELGLQGKMQGVVVTSVEPDSGAERAGLMPGDVIREINRQPVTSVKDFEKISAHLKKGERVLFLINRQGASLFLSVKV